MQIGLIAKKRSGVWGCAIALFLSLNSNAQVSVPITFEQPLHNGNYPELAYWFVTPETFAAGQAARDIQHIAKDTRFTFPFLTERNGVNFSELFPPNDFVPPSCPQWPPWCSRFSGNARSHDLIAEMTKNAHASGLKLGITFNWLVIDTEQRIPTKDAQTVVSSAEDTLDGQGRATLTVGSKLRFAPPIKSELLRVYVFTKTANGEYDPRTLQDVTARARGVSRTGDPTTGLMEISVKLGPKYAGKTVVAMQQTWLNALDLQSDAYMRWVHNTLDEYRDVPLDGTALDEFGYTRLLGNPPWRGLFAGEAFQARFEATTHMKLPETLFAMRYAPSNQPEVRIRAIDEYWDFIRTGPQRIELEFYNYSKTVFGKTAFAGIHDTIHNHLTNDEPWASGLNWWMIPRQYGMSDEDLSLPLRMGLLVSHPGKIMYDQFYGRDIHKFAEKALDDARFNARIHYHGYNDVGAWGVDLSTEPFLNTINPIEEKIRLLNRFDPAAPELPLLVVFGMPRLLNWYPNDSDRNSFDVNGALHVEEKVKAVWDAGYRCAVVPSDLIDNGMLQLDAQGVPEINGHKFRAILYLYPEYAKRSTLSFLEDYVQRGGALMLEGTATRDFDGNPITERFFTLAAKARATGFDIKRLDKLGITKDPLQKIGGSLEDGGVILTDLVSLEKHTSTSFSITLKGHAFKGSYQGVFAIKTAEDGTIEKLACGQCGPLSRDGHETLRLQQPADLLLRKSGDGYRAVVVGDHGTNSVHIVQ